MLSLTNDIPYSAHVPSVLIVSELNGRKVALGSGCSRPSGSAGAVRSLSKLPSPQAQAESAGSSWTAPVSRRVAARPTALERRESDGTFFVNAEITDARMMCSPRGVVLTV